MGCEMSQQNATKAEIPSHRYLQRELKAKGTHATVYKVYDSRNKKEYAQKVIQKLPNFSSLQQIHPDFQAYFNKLTSLKHQNLVNYSDIFCNDGKLYIIMDLAQQCTLLQYIQSKGKLSQFQSAKIIRNVLYGVQYLHNQGLLHNDLKPSNILLFQNGVVKISDYCIAELFDTRLLKQKDKQASSNKWDKIPYMAPQIVKNLGTSKLADVWSVGCMLIEMLTGKKPWLSFGSPEQTLKKIATDAVPPLPTQITATCSSFLENCLAIVPSQRSSVAQLLNHPFVLVNKPKKGYSTESKKKQKYTNSQLKQAQIFQPAQNYFSVNEAHENKEISPSIEKKSYQKVKREKQVRNSFGKLAKLNNKHQTQAIVDPLNKDSKSNYQTVEYEHLKQQQEENTVMLNNRRVKLAKHFYKNNNNQRFSTDATEWTSPSRIKMKEIKQGRSVMKRNEQKDQLDALSANNSIFTANSRLILPEIGRNQQKSRLRVKTEIQPEFDRQYYKKPLQLLKQKIQERKVHKNFEERLQTELRKYSALHQNRNLLQDQGSYDREEAQNSVEYAKSNREQAIIDTEVARFQRDYFQKNQKLMLQRRKEERLKWQNELKSGKEMLKKQVPFRYYIK